MAHVLREPVLEKLGDGFTHHIEHQEILHHFTNNSNIICQA